MALQPQFTVVPFRSGLDTKADSKQIPPPQLLVAENVVFTTPGKLRTRNGFTGLAQTILGAIASISAGQALMQYLAELLLCDGSDLFSWDEGSEQWCEKGPILSCVVTEQPVVRNSYTQTAQDGVTEPNGLQLYAWEDSSGGARYSIVDTNTQQVLVPTTLIDTNGTRVKTIVAGNVFAIYYYDTFHDQIWVATVPVSTPTATPMKTALTGASTDTDSPSQAFPNFDVCVAPDTQNAYLVFNNNDATAPGPTLYRYSIANVTAGPTKLVLYSGPDFITADYGITVNYAPFSWTDIDGNVFAFGVSILFSGVDQDAAQSTQFANIYADITDLIVTQIDSEPFYYLTFSQILADAGLTNQTDSGIRLFLGVNTVGGATQIYQWLRPDDPDEFYQAILEATVLRVYPIAKSFPVGSQVYCPVIFATPIDDGSGFLTALQPTVFVINDLGATVAKALPGISVIRPLDTFTPIRPVLPETTSISSTQFRFSAGVAEQLTVSTGIIRTNSGVTSVALDFFNPSQSFLRAELARDIHISGGFLWMYDGVRPVEHGFHWYPEGTDVSTSGSGGAITDGFHEWIAIYSWTDNQGQIHYSAPSPVTSATSKTTSGGNTSSASVTVPTLTLTAKSTPVTVCLYRTEADSVTGDFFFVNSIANDTTATFVTISDTLSDDDLTGNQALYTNGGVLENISAPACGSMCVHRNRVVLLSTESPLTLWYSKQSAPPVSTLNPAAPVEFTDSFTLTIDPRGGDVTAVASMDDKLIVFKRNSIFFVTGQGPDNTGGNNDFSDSVLITTDCGCINPRSVVTTPQGLMFQSSKGIYLLDRGLGASYIGASVERYNEQTVTSAQLIPSTNQVRFTLAASDNFTARALVFDYFATQWSVFTNINAVDSAIWDDTFVYLQSGGLALQETPGVYSDNGDWISVSVTTGWFQFAGIQGFQRIRDTLLLGELISPHILNVAISYDFEPVVMQTAALTPVPNGTWGGSGSWGAGRPWGGSIPRYQWRTFMQRQKCQSMQFSFSTQAPLDGTIGEGASFSALGFQFGIKPGAFRLPASQST